MVRARDTQADSDGSGHEERRKESNQRSRRNNERRVDTGETRDELRRPRLQARRLLHEPHDLRGAGFAGRPGHADPY